MYGTVNSQGKFADLEHQEHRCCREKEMVNWKCLRDWPHNTKRHAKHPDLARGLPLYYKLALQSAWGEDKQLTMFHMLYCSQRLRHSMSHCWCCTLQQIVIRLRIVHHLLHYMFGSAPVNVQNLHWLWGNYCKFTDTHTYVYIRICSSFTEYTKFGPRTQHIKSTVAQLW